jgi:hypothetical protein
MRPILACTLVVLVAACAADPSAEPAGSLPGSSTDDAIPATSTTSSSPTDDDESSSSDDSAADDEDSSSGAPVGPKLDVGPDGSETGPSCDPAQDICCLDEGELPPHALLDAFLIAYPSAAMPMTMEAILAFAPTADEHAMAWSDENVGGELVDPAAGGVIPANLEAGRVLAREAALLALPAGASVLAMRDDMPVVEVLGGPGGCNGVGWAWGSLLFHGIDDAIGELVYLYIGYCAGDVWDVDDLEVFYYSDQAAQICAPPG